MKKALLNIFLSVTFVAMFAQNFAVEPDLVADFDFNTISVGLNRDDQPKSMTVRTGTYLQTVFLNFGINNKTAVDATYKLTISYKGSIIFSDFSNRVYKANSVTKFVVNDEPAIGTPLMGVEGESNYVVLELRNQNADIVQSINLIKITVASPYVIKDIEDDCPYFMSNETAYDPRLCFPLYEYTHKNQAAFNLGIRGPKYSFQNPRLQLYFQWQKSTDNVNFVDIPNAIGDDLNYWVTEPCVTFYVRRKDIVWNTGTSTGVYEMLGYANHKSIKVVSLLNGKINTYDVSININGNNVPSNTYEIAVSDGSKLISMRGMKPSATGICGQGDAIVVSIQWQYLDPYFPKWQNIPNQTGIDLYGNFDFVDGTKIRRVLTSPTDTRNSNEVTIIRKNCFTPTSNQTDQTNRICVATKAYYNLYTGAVVNPETIVGTSIVPNITTREYAYEWLYSTDGVNWSLVSGKRLTDNDRAATNRDFTPSSVTFDVAKGEVQKLYFKRDYFHYYDKWNCGFTGIQSCGKNYHYQSTSNIIMIYLSAYPKPKPIPVDFNEPAKTLTCAPADQNLTLSVTDLNQWGTQYSWTYPDAWIPYSIATPSTTYNTQSVHKNAVNGGKVCLTITQTDVSRTICRDYAGTTPMTASLLPIYGGCAGQQFQIVPTIGNREVNSLRYTWTMSNPLLANTSCLTTASDNSCSGLRYTPKNVAMGNTQMLSLNVVDAKACSLTVQTVVRSDAGWFFGTLNYLDPIAIQGSDLVLDNSKNELYYINTNKRIQKAYYGDEPTKTNVAGSRWQFQEIGGSLVKSNKSVALYRNQSNYKLFYVEGTILKYVESLDRGVTWSQTATSVGSTAYLDKLRSYGTFIYAVQSNNRYVYKIDGSNPSLAAVQVTNEPVNNTDFTFNIDGGLVVYTNTSNKLVVFNAAATNVSVLDATVNVTDLKAGSDLRVYNSIVWMVRNDGKLYTLSKNTTTNRYDLLASVNYASYVTYNNVAPVLDGKFCINYGTGVIYAKDQRDYGMDHLFQIANKNGGWRLLELAGDGYSQTGVGYAMTYGFSHAYYIGADGRVGNNFYLEPCRPDVLRKEMAEASEVVQDGEKFAYTEVDYDLQVSPNPTVDAINIGYHLPEASEVSFSLTNMTGVEEALQYKSQSMAGDFTWNLDLKDRPQGMYILHILVNGQKVAHHKVVKQ